MGLGAALRHQRHLAPGAHRSMGQSAHRRLRDPAARCEQGCRPRRCGSRSRGLVGRPGTDQRAVFRPGGTGSDTLQIGRRAPRRPNVIDIPVEIRQPKLWYPAGYGDQPLYEFTARIVSSRADRRQTNKRRQAFARSSFDRHLDQWGRCFELVVNGIPVFAKGADVIPFDSFPNRVTTADYRRILESARDANMNMIRHWGGGYYETRRVLSDLRRTRHHGLAGLHVRQRLAARHIRLQTQHRSRSRGSGPPPAQSSQHRGVVRQQRDRSGLELERRATSCRSK